VPADPKYLHKITWVARGLSIAIALFTSIFALDVFTTSASWDTVIIDLCMHLIPTILVVFLLLIAWHWEKLGGLLYCLLGIFYIFISIKANLHWTARLIIALPLLINGMLYLFVGFRKQKEI
jgi:hypothetical protein